MQDLGLLPGYTESIAYDINNRGQVVGCGYRLGGYSVGFLYSGGSMQTLGYLGSIQCCRALGISDSGQIVGYSQVGGGSYSYLEGFLYSGGTMQGIAGNDSVAYAVNNNGQIVGHAAGTWYAFLDSGGTIQNLGTLPGYANSEAFDINDNGQVVGESFGSNGYGHAFLYSGGTMHDLGTLAGYPYSSANAINNAGEIVGWVANASYQADSVLYSNGAIVDLNNLLAAESGWTLQGVSDINDNGQICGYGINPSGQHDAVLLTPTPEPSTFALLGAATAAMLAYAWRRRGRLASHAFVSGDAQATLSFPSRLPEATRRAA